MSEPTNPLDKLFRDKLENRSFPVDMNHWNEATKLIDKNRKKRRGFFWIFGAMGILVIGGVMFGFSNLTLTSKNTLANKNNNLDANENIIDRNDTDPNLASANQINEIEATKNDLSKANIEKSDFQKVTLKTESSQQAENNNRSNNTIKSQNNGPNFTASNNVRKDLLANSKDQNSAHNNFDQQTQLNNIEENLDDNNIGMGEGKIGLASNTNIAKKDQEIVSWSTALIPSNTFLPSSIFVSELSKTKFVKWEEVDPELENQPRLKMGFYLEGLLNPLNSNQESFAGFRIGLIAKYLLSSTLSLQFEPGYHQYSGLRMYSKIRQDNIYDFGLSQEIYAMKAKTAHYLSLPISLNYKIKKHGIELGTDLNYLLGVQGNVQEVKLENILNEPGLTRNARVSEVVESLSTGWLDMTPFASFSGRYFVGYNYMVNRGFILGARAYFQPNSILETAPEELQKLSHTKFLVGVQAKFIIE